MTDTERLDFLERWVASSRARGYKWDTFTFNMEGKTVREQLDEQMKAGMVELEKRSGTGFPASQSTSAEGTK